MNSLSRRIDKIEERLEPDAGPVLRFPNGDGTFMEVRGVRSLNDPQIALAVARRCRQADEDRRQTQAD